MKLLLKFLITFWLTHVARTAVVKSSEVDFHRDIRPILSEYCFVCHGPDRSARKADLRLDVPGTDMTKVLMRISTSNVHEVMPPPDSPKPKLSATQIATLKTWIDDGAKYQKHWAFEPLQPRMVLEQRAPTRDHRNNATIDMLVSASLKLRSLNFAPEADHETLVRRVAFDLTGLPPTSAMLEKPYDAVVDELLSSPHFGEHLASGWLDLARYADTNGYFDDKPRQIWLWRDWVIDAFNANMPFDQFSIEQLAGDLLPNASLKQRIATGFNRNPMANNETGIIDEEFRVEYVVDRINTTMTTWLGLTAGCAQCHDHKYDPITQREYYQLYAFFNNVPERGLITTDNPPPVLSVPTDKQIAELEQAGKALQQSQEAFAPVRSALVAQIASWEKSGLEALPCAPMPCANYFSLDAPTHEKLSHHGNMVEYQAGIQGMAAKFDGTQHLECNEKRFAMDQPWTIGLWVKAEGSLSCPLSIIDPEGPRRGFELIWQKGRVQVHLVNHWVSNAIEVSTTQAISTNAWHHIAVSYDGKMKADGLHVYLDGKQVELDVRRNSLTGSIENQQPIRIGRRDRGLGFYGLIDEVRVLPGAITPRQAEDWYWGERIRGIVEIEPQSRSATDTDLLLDFYIDRFSDPPTQQLRKALLESMRLENTLKDSIPTTLIMQEMSEPRPTYILERGEYNKPGDRVFPNVPESIAPWNNDLPKNRLGFAKWLFLPNNPLTARVAVNRLWMLCFGDGLVRTPDDFGSQGESPIHLELLDRLAVEFRESGWDTKSLLKSIVMSKTYRQASVHTHSTDPENRLLARGPSGRLSSEMIRDQALAISGLLISKVGGPSVKPYQPPGLWEAVSYNGNTSYVPDKGEGLWRRSLYTYVKRQAPPPMLLNFDGPTREKCTARRSRTNTPLQALQLLNDQTFVMAANELANLSLGHRNRIGWMFRSATCRDPTPEELRLLEGLFERHQSLPVVANTILNLDEVLTKR